MYLEVDRVGIMYLWNEAYHSKRLISIDAYQMRLSLVGTRGVSGVAYVDVSQIQVLFTEACDVVGWS
jgi:hypothetical protein